MAAKLETCAAAMRYPTWEIRKADRAGLMNTVYLNEREEVDNLRNLLQEARQGD